MFSSGSSGDLFDSTSVWLVSESALNAPSRPTGLLSGQLQFGKLNSELLLDALALVTKGIVEFDSKLRRESPDDLNDLRPPAGCISTPLEERWLRMAPYLLSSIKSIRLEDAREPNVGLPLGARTGRLEMNEFGDRISARYDVLNTAPNIQQRNVEEGSNLVPVGAYETGKGVERLRLFHDEIVWPGGGRQRPKGRRLAQHIRVVSIAEKPFMTSYELPPLTDPEIQPNCSQFQKPGPDQPADDLDPIVLCRRRITGDEEVVGAQIVDDSQRYQLLCCKGYVVELVQMLAASLNVSYELSLSPDGRHGDIVVNQTSGEQEWDGMVGELLRSRADMIVAPFVVTPERADAVDFSKPFKYQGMTILVRKTAKDSSLGSFLQPFEKSLWLLVFVAVHVVAAFLYLFDRFSPFGRFKLAAQDDAEEDALNLSTAVWFAWGVLLNSGIGEGTPRSFSARVLGIVWAGFAMIIVASYTAKYVLPQNIFSNLYLYLLLY